MPFFDPIRIGAAGGTAEAYTIDRSLRFNRSDNAYLSRTPSSAGNRKTFTYSAWVKLGQTGTNSSTNQGNGLFLSCGAAGTGTNMTLRITNNGYIGVDYYGIGGYYSTGRLRDLSAWYHCVFVMDTTESTAANRFKVYVNGDLIYNNQLGLSQNADTPFNNNSVHTIGAYAYNTSHSYRLDAYLAEVHFLDGYAYDPTYFGATDSTTGQWNPKKYTGSYGTNGFYLNFSSFGSTSALGTDSSGNGNNFSVSNFSVASNLAYDSMPDTPTKNFCVLNPLNATSSFNFNIGEGNLVFDQTSNDQAITGTFFISPQTGGKWYWEIYKNSGQNPEIGICDQRTLSQLSTGIHDGRLAFVTNSGNIIRTGSSSTASLTGGTAQTGAGWIRIACDMDNKKIWWSDTSGNYFNSGNPATGANAGYDFSSHATASGWAPYVFMGTGSGHNCYMNFGQFDLNSFSSNIPTGFKTLSSDNLPEPAVQIGNKNFDILTYTGTNSSQTITGLNFQPDWVWLKSINASHNHGSIDSVRGRSKVLFQNSDAEEQTSGASNDLVSFNSNGITVGSVSALSSANNSGTNIIAWNWNAGDSDAKTYKVKVVADSTDYGHGTGSNKYQFFKSDGTTGFGTNGVDLELAEGGTYIFDWSDSSAQLHPIRFSLTNDGTHSSGTSAGTEYTTGVTKDDSAYKTTITIASGVADLYYYCQNHSGMGAQIYTNSTLGSTNFDGSLVTVAKPNVTAGFSIVRWQIPSTAVYTVGHGLGAAPKAIFMKSRDGDTNWDVFHTSVGNTKRLRLNSDDTPDDYTGPWNDTDPTSTVFTSTGSWLGANKNIVAYVFAEIEGYSKFGSYVGNANSNGPYVYLGFRPRFLIIKETDDSNNWIIMDTKRGEFNDDLGWLYADLAYYEETGSGRLCDFTSNGFKVRSAGTGINSSNDTYIYFAWAELPFKNARAR